jgi:hypothetical protein
MLGYLKAKLARSSSGRSGSPAIWSSFTAEILRFLTVVPLFGTFGTNPQPLRAGRALPEL